MAYFKKHGLAVTVLTATLPMVVLLGSVTTPAWAEPEKATSSPAKENGNPEDDYKAGTEAYKINDWVSAGPLFLRAAEAGHVPSMNMLAYILSRAQEVESAVAWYRKAADKGSLEAALGLGRMIAEGSGVKKDPAEGLKWITRSAEGGYLPAMTVLAKIYMQGELNVEVSHEKARAWFNKAVEGGNDAAMTEMALVYRNGLLGLKADPQKADALEAEIKKKSQEKAKP